jgi:hypothetical protein
MLYLGEALKIPPVELLPKLDPAKRLGENIVKLRTKRATAAASSHFAPSREPRIPDAMGGHAFSVTPALSTKAAASLRANPHLSHSGGPSC